MTAGQRAIAVARIYPEPDKPGRGNKGKASGTDGFSQVRLREARQIVPYRDLADLTLAGKMKFDHALQLARERTKLQENADYYLGRHNFPVGRKPSIAVVGLGKPGNFL